MRFVVDEETKSEASSIHSNDLTEMLRAVLSSDEVGACPPPLGIFMTNIQDEHAPQSASIRELVEEDDSSEDEEEPSTVPPIVADVATESPVVADVATESPVVEDVATEPPVVAEPESLPEEEVKKMLARKTNDELRTILRERDGTAPKGASKAELVARIMGAVTAA